MMDAATAIGANSTELQEGGHGPQQAAASPAEERLFWAGRFLSREKYLQIPTFLRWGRIPASLRSRG